MRKYLVLFHGDEENPDVCHVIEGTDFSIEGGSVVIYRDEAAVFASPLFKAIVDLSIQAEIEAATAEYVNSAE